MTAVWQVVPGERRVTFSPVALDLRDDFTGGNVPDPVTLKMELQSGANWIEAAIKPVRTSRGVFVYTGLGRAIDPLAVPQFRVRVTIEAPQHRALYQSNDDSIEFDVPTYNDATPPVMSPLVPDVIPMLPTASYRFAVHVRIIRGRVLNAGGAPLANAVVEADGVERVMTDESGSYALPLRWQAVNAVVQVDASHPRSTAVGQRMLQLPNALNGSQDITVN